MKSFLQNSGNGIGPQILTDVRNLGAPADPVPAEEFKPKRGRKTKLAAMGLSLTIINAGDPEYALLLENANKYRKTRMKELQQLHGHVSAGAGALLASESIAMAASRYLYQRASSNPDAATLKQAAQLADSARQAGLAAYELASREGILRKRMDMATEGMPWMERESKPGRKSNLERHQERMLTPPVVDSVPVEDPDAR